MFIFHLKIYQCSHPVIVAIIVIKMGDDEFDMTYEFFFLKTSKKGQKFLIR